MRIRIKAKVSLKKQFKWGIDLDRGVYLIVPEFYQRQKFRERSCNVYSTGQSIAVTECQIVDTHYLGSPGRSEWYGLATRFLEDLTRAQQAKLGANTLPMNPMFIHNAGTERIYWTRDDNIIVF